MRKVTLTAASIALALGLVGCGEKEQENKAPATATVTEAKAPLKIIGKSKETGTEITFLPSAVDIRSLNPCLFFRFVFDG